VPAEVPRKDAGPSKRAGKDDEKHDVESEGKYELHISNISLKATESELRKLCESHGETYRVKLLRRGTMQKAFVDMENERVALKCIEALDGYDLHEQTLEVKFSDAEMARSYPTSKFKRRQGGRGDYRDGDGDRDQRDEGYKERYGGGARGGGRGRGRGGRGDDGGKWKSGYGDDKRGGYSNKNDDYYDYDDDDYYDDEDDSYVRRGDKDSGYNKRGGGGGHYEKRDYRGGDSRGGSRGGGYNNKDTWRDNRGYYDRNQDGDSRSKPSGGYDKNRGGADDNSQAENEERVVYVSNLNYQTDENGLKKAFKEFGFIERVHLNCRRGDGKSLGNAQV
jgi:RNA recognition motif-containing protein